MYIRKWLKETNYITYASLRLIMMITYEVKECHPTGSPRGVKVRVIMEIITQGPNMHEFLSF